MFLKDINKRLIKSVAVLGCILGLTGCSHFNEDLQDCPVKLNVRFIYDYNLKFADAFRHEVKSVYVWAFDQSGKLVWSDSASGSMLKEADFALDTPLGEGTYDFISWCGLKDNADFNLNTYTPASKEELEVKLKTQDYDNESLSRSHLPGLFHGMVMNETFTVKPNQPSLKTVTIPLMKDTNDIRVLLHRYDGTELKKSDFEVKITIPDAWLSWNNNVLPQGPMVTYRPWDIRYGSVNIHEQDNDPNKTITISSLIYDLSSSRLIKDSNAWLTVIRTSDRKEIINIKIIDYFLMVMGHYYDEDGKPLSDQDYLDRQDDYSILFFIDEDNDWYRAACIYINSWAVVPPQNETL